MVSRETYMKLALEEAKKGYDKEEVPVGAVIVMNNEVIAKAHNLKEQTKFVTAHAEILAITQAIEKIEDWRLCECEIYVTLEPCIMCFGAIAQSRIKKTYIGTYNNSNKEEFRKYINKELNIEYGIKKEECSQILKKFFKTKRK